MRPTIGIGCDYEVAKREYCKLYPDYVDAVREAGAVPLLLAPMHDAEYVADLLDRVDGILFTGGEDIDPRHYGQERHGTTKIMPERRFAFDRLLLSSALARGVPVLAICYGIQLLNVALGGDLIQDIPSLVRGSIVHRAPPEPDGPPAAEAAQPRPRVRHDVAIEPGSLLQKAAGTDRFAVASSHHQAVGRVAPTLRVAARAPDGIIEALEPATPDGRFVLGVQWHPEDANALPRRPELFRALRDAAHARAAAAEGTETARRG